MGIRILRLCIQPILVVSSVSSINEDGQTSLHLACQDGDCEQVKELLLTPGIDVNSRDDMGMTPLHTTELAPNIEHAVKVANILLADERVDPNTVNREGRSLLGKSIFHGCLPMVQALLACPRTNPNIQDVIHGHRWSALCAAADLALIKTDRMPIFECLANHLRTNPNQVDAQGLKTLGYIFSIIKLKFCFQPTMQNFVSIVKALVSHPAIYMNGMMGRHGWTPLYAALQYFQEVFNEAALRVIKVMVEASHQKQKFTDRFLRDIVPVKDMKLAFQLLPLQMRCRLRAIITSFTVHGQLHTGVLHMLYSMLFGYCLPPTIGPIDIYRHPDETRRLYQIINSNIYLRLNTYLNQLIREEDRESWCGVDDISEYHAARVRLEKIDDGCHIIKESEVKIRSK